jgi:hypothetical protein
MHTLGLRKFSLILFAAIAIGLAAMVALPQDKFLRYQALNDGTAPTAYWIYQRIHRDPTAIDVAFIGTSRTGMSIHSGRLERDLEQMGTKASVANLHIVKTGVDMQYVVAKELLESRKVKILVVEMLDWEDRKTHPDFIYLADSTDVLSAPLFINMNFFSNLVRLPGRQVDLFLQTQEKRFGWSAPSYVPAYEGPNLDHSEFIRTLDGVRHERNGTHTRAEMEELRKEQESLITPALLPPSMNDLEFRIPRYYMNRILDLARAHNTSVVFLYTPRYGGPQQPAPYQRYANRAELVNPWALLQEYSLWDDDTHLNWEGAKRMTDFVAQELANRKELR